MANELNFDVIVLGSGLKEEMIGGLLCMKDKKVLFVEAPESFYTRQGINDCVLESTKDEIQTVFRANKEKELGPVVKDLAENIMPEFMKKSNGLYQEFAELRVWMNDVHLMKFLEINYKMVSGDMYRVARKHRIPLDADELLDSGLMGFIEKRRYLAFRDYCIEYRQDIPKTHKCFDATEAKNDSKALYKDFGFDAYAEEFNGQAVARYCNEKYLTRPAFELIRRVQLLHNNLAGNAISPYFFPLYSFTNGTTASSKIRRYSKTRSAVYVKHESDDPIPIGSSAAGHSVKVGNKTYTGKVVVCNPAFAPDDMRESQGILARQVFICKRFDLLSDKEEDHFKLGVHWRIPYKQMRKMINKRSDMCFTFLSPELLLSKEGGQIIEATDPKYIGMLEAMVDEKGRTDNDAAQPIEDKLKDAYEWTKIVVPQSETNPTEINYVLKKFDMVMTKLYGPTIPWNKSPKTSLVVTNSSEASTPFEVVCGEAVDIVKHVMAILNPPSPPEAKAAAPAPSAS